MSIKRDLTKILVVDVECTAWEHEARPDSDLKTIIDPPSEIIEIGIAELYTEGERKIVSLPSLFVKPQFSTVSDFCTTLTGITSEKLDQEGISFAAACEQLKALGSRKHHFASWGMYDWLQFRKQCEDYLNYPYPEIVRPPFGSTHLNIKTLYSIVMKQRQHLGQGNAAKLMFGEFEGTQHSGKDDAYNGAKVLRKLLYPTWDHSPHSEECKTQYHLDLESRTVPICICGKD